MVQLYFKPDIIILVELRKSLSESCLVGLINWPVSAQSRDEFALIITIRVIE